MSDHSGFADQLQINKEQYEIKIKQEQEKQQEGVNKQQTKNKQATTQKVKNTAFNNIDNLSPEILLSTEKLEEKLNETDGDEEIAEQKEKILSLVETTFTVPIVSETVNKPSFKTSNSLLQAKQGQKVKLADDTKVLEKSAEIEAQKLTEAEEKLQKQPQELVENYKALLGFMKEFKDSCQQETNKSNSALMNNVITQVSAFESLVNSKEFNLGKQYDYIPQLVNMRNAVALYYEKNKGFKWTSKGRRRRELSKNLLNKLNEWVGNMPDPIVDTYVAEMEKDEHEKIRDLESSKEMYMSLGTAVLKKQLLREGKTVLKEAPKEGVKNKNVWTEEKIREYVNPDSVRYISMARQYYANKVALEKLAPTEAERKELEAKAEAKYGKSTYHDPRCFGYQWGQVKVNYDGSPADETEAAKLKNIKKSMKNWYSDEVSGMKPYFDEYIKKFIDFNAKLENYTPEQMHKNGPSLYAIADGLLSIQNMLESDTLARKYVESLYPSVMFRLKKIADMTTYGTMIKAYVEGQNVLFFQEIKLKNSNKWKKPMDINKSKKLIDLLIKSPEETDKMYQSGDATSEPQYCSEIQGVYKENGKEYKYVFYLENEFEFSLINQTNGLTIKGDYYSEKNAMARRNARAQLFYKDVPKFNLEHPELDEPICAVYQKLEDTEEKIANIAIEIESLTDEVEIGKKRTERAALEAARGDILKERDAIVEERTKNPGSPYTAYAYEAKQESAKHGFTISPEAVAYMKSRTIRDDFVNRELSTEEGKGVVKTFGKDTGKTNRIYAQKIRAVKYKDGEPATQEDKENLEYNRAYAKSIIENNQEERIRLLKENCEYVANLINKVDFDRVGDVNYWIQNPELFITLSNFTTNGLEVTAPAIHEEDGELMKEFFDNKTAMMKLLGSFTDAFRFLQGVLDRAGQSQGILFLNYVPVSELDSKKGESEEVLDAMSAMFAEAKENLVAYNASKNK